MSYWVSVGLLAIVVLVLGIVIEPGDLPSGLLAAVIAVVGLIKGWLERVATLYTITDRRIIIRKGILSRHERAAHIDRVQNVNLTQSFVDRIFQVGTLDFDTAGTGGTPTSSSPASRTLTELRTKIDTEYVRRSREMPSPGV